MQNQNLRPFELSSRRVISKVIPRGYLMQHLGFYLRDLTSDIRNAPIPERLAALVCQFDQTTVQPTEVHD